MLYISGNLIIFQQCFIESIVHMGGRFYQFEKSQISLGQHCLIKSMKNADMFNVNVRIKALELLSFFNLQQKTPIKIKCSYLFISSNKTLALRECKKTVFGIPKSLQNVLFKKSKCWE